MDIAGLLDEISPDAPCGENLEYDPAFVALERAIAGKPEQQIGDTIVPAEEPDWQSVRDMGFKLLQRSKDLRVAIHLIRGLVHTQGWVGLRDGLTLVRSLIERYWESLHPQLDPEDDNDPTLRLNTLATLADPEAMLGALRTVPLVDSPVFGRFSLRDLLVASGEISPAGDGSPPPDMNTINAAFKQADLVALQGIEAALLQSIESMNAIEESLMDRVGAEQTPGFEGLRGMLESAHKALSSRLAERPDSTAPEEPVAENTTVALDVSAGASPAVPAVRTPTGPISSRDDIVRLLDLMCEYYRRHEPSSPVPLLLRRAKRLATMDFMDIMRDLAPDGLSRIELIRGAEAQDAGK